MQGQLKRGLNASAKSIDPCQPAQSAQADMDETFRHFFNYFCMSNDHSTLCFFQLFEKKKKPDFTSPNLGLIFFIMYNIDALTLYHIIMAFNDPVYEAL